MNIVGGPAKKGGAFHGYGQQWWDVGNRVRVAVYSARL